MRVLSDSPTPVRRGLTYLFLLGVFLTARGYRSREVDQAYRLPVLLHQQDARLFAGDPFVLSFDTFNPHRGYLALIDAFARPLGLSAALAVLFVLTFFLTVAGISRLAGAFWDDPGGKTGAVAASLVLLAQAGNVGTNHLFEPMLLDRLVAFGLGWVALAVAVEDPGRNLWRASVLIGLAAVVHPSVGLQLAMLLGVARLAWVVVGVGGGGARAWLLGLGSVAVLAAAVLPGLSLNLSGSRILLEGLSPRDVHLLGAELQSPQHMLPHLWRLPQWLAWGCYPALAVCSLSRRPGREGVDETGRSPGARSRLLVLLGVNLLGLGLAWVAIEPLQNLRATLFQPFRMATVARGLCLVLVAGRVRQHWEGGGVIGRLRAVLVALGLVGDWMLVAASAFEVSMTVGDVVGPRLGTRRAGVVAGFLVLVAGLVFLSRHDTESGHVPLAAAAVAVVVVARLPRFRTPHRGVARGWALLAASWVVPASAIVANVLPDGGAVQRAALVRRCRFAERPLDDLERLAVWCRDHTPPGARFVGPPGPKTFRLWSLRSLAFNRAGSPYHAAGLADWSRRFRDHVGFEGTNAEFVRAYLKDRHALERRYDALTPSEKAALARRQGADHVLAASPKGGDRSRGGGGPLTLLKAEGRYAVYRVSPPSGVAVGRPGVEDTGPRR